VTNGATLTGYPSNAVVAVGGVATTYVVRATANENTNIYASASLNVVELQSIELVSGATSSNVVPSNTWATVKNTTVTPGYVVLRAVLNPTIGESAFSDGFISWAGGESVTGHPLQRRVSKDASVHTQVVATCGNMSATGDVWVIWADLEIRITGSTTNTPNSARFSDQDKTFDGTENLGVQLYDYKDQAGNFISRAAAGKVIPIGHLYPTGINAITINGWSIERDMMRHDYKDGCQWTNRWEEDIWVFDSLTPEKGKKFNPDNYDQIYDMDAPNVAKIQGGVEGNVTDSFERYDNFRQRVTWNGTNNVCSTNAYWHFFACWKYTNAADTNLQITVTNLGVGYWTFPATNTYPPP